MAKTLITKSLLALLATVASASLAEAGGFSRGSADTTILYEDGDFDLRGGVLYVMPQRDFQTVGANNAVTDDPYSQSYAIQSVAAKIGVGSAACALTYTQPFGGHIDYGPQTELSQGVVNPTLEAEFTSNEYGATCGAKFDLEKGRAWIIGGVYMQDFDYIEKAKFGTLHLKDSSAIGYRLGAAYEIPEYALRGEILYRSSVKHEASGTFVTNAVPLLVPAGLSFVSTGVGTLPQSLELNFQSGIAPDWLAFGNLKWTDWSVLRTLDYTITAPAPIGGAKVKNYYYQDGWTVTGGVGHKFNDDVSGSLSLTWDKGVGTGADIQTDTWTVATGAQIKAGPGTLRIGGAVSYLTAGSQSTAQHAPFNATSDADWAYSLGTSYLVKF